MLDERYRHAVKVRLAMDNLNTHDFASLYETFAPAEARRLAERIEIHYTPKHGSWLNIAEIECKRAQPPVPAPPHRFVPRDAKRNRGLAIRSQPSRRTRELALPHRGCTNQTHSPLSETIDVTGY